MTAPATPTSRRWTLSNGLTALRLLAAPLIHCAIDAGAWSAGCALFWAAVASDWGDGRLARARGESSAFGGLLDHGSDAVFVTSALLALAGQGRAPTLLPIVVAVAFAVYVVDSRVFSGRPLRPHALGRWNGILYFVPPGVVLTREAFALSVPPDGLVRALGWALVASTSVSIGVRIRTRFKPVAPRDRAPRRAPDSPDAGTGVRSRR